MSTLALPKLESLFVYSHLAIQSRPNEYPHSEVDFATFKWSAWGAQLISELGHGTIASCDSRYDARRLAFPDNNPVGHNTLVIREAFAENSDEINFSQLSHEVGTIAKLEGLELSCMHLDGGAIYGANRKNGFLRYMHRWACGVTGGSFVIVDSFATQFDRQPLEVYGAQHGGPNFNEGDRSAGGNQSQSLLTVDEHFHTPSWLQGTDTAGMTEEDMVFNFSAGHCNSASRQHTTVEIVGSRRAVLRSRCGIGPGASHIEGDAVGEIVGWSAAGGGSFVDDGLTNATDQLLALTLHQHQFRFQGAAPVGPEGDTRVFLMTTGIAPLGPEPSWISGCTEDNGTEDSGCCTWDFPGGCQGDEWCSASRANCEGSCTGTWINGTPPPAHESTCVAVCVGSVRYRVVVTPETGAFDASEAGTCNGNEAPSPPDTIMMSQTPSPAAAPTPLPASAPVLNTGCVETVSNKCSTYASAAMQKARGYVPNTGVHPEFGAPGSTATSTMADCVAGCLSSSACKSAIFHSNASSYAFNPTGTAACDHFPVQMSTANTFSGGVSPDWTPAAGKTYFGTPARQDACIGTTTERRNHNANSRPTFAGSFIAQASGLDLATCTDSCESTYSCRSFTFLPSNGKCQLYASKYKSPAYRTDHESKQHYWFEDCTPACPTATVRNILEDFALVPQKRVKRSHAWSYQANWAALGVTLTNNPVFDVQKCAQLCQQQGELICSSFNFMFDVTASGYGQCRFCEAHNLTSKKNTPKTLTSPGTVHSRPHCLVPFAVLRHARWLIHHPCSTPPPPRAPPHCSVQMQRPTAQTI